MTSGEPSSPSPVEIKADFTTITPNVAATQYDINQAQESIRHWLSWTMVAIFGLTILGAFATILINPKLWPQVKDLFTIAISTESALLGSAIGFYFGTKR